MDVAELIQLSARPVNTLNAWRYPNWLPSPTIAGLWISRPEQGQWPYGR